MSAERPRFAPQQTRVLDCSPHEGASRSCSTLKPIRVMRQRQEHLQKPESYRSAPRSGSFNYLGLSDVRLVLFPRAQFVWYSNHEVYSISGGGLQVPGVLHQTPIRTKWFTWGSRSTPDEGLDEVLSRRFIDPAAQFNTKQIKVGPHLD